MHYNTERPHLIIPEYGRHIQEMVNHCKTIQDNKERNDFAQAIITVMGNLNPHLRDVPDFQHKLWDQLFIMSEFDLDVQSPYTIPNKKDFEEKPNRVAYPKENNRYRYYGKNIQRMIDEACEWEEGEKKDGLIKAIANQMKKSFLLWNKDTVQDDVIFNQLKDMSDGKLDLTQKEVTLSPPEKLVNTNGRNGHASPSKKRNKKNRKRY